MWHWITLNTIARYMQCNSTWSINCTYSDLRAHTHNVLYLKCTSSVILWRKLYSRPMWLCFGNTSQTIQLKDTLVHFLLYERFSWCSKIWPSVMWPSFTPVPLKASVAIWMCSSFLSQAQPSLHWDSSCTQAWVWSVGPTKHTSGRSFPRKQHHLRTTPVSYPYLGMVCTVLSSHTWTTESVQ